MKRTFVKLSSILCFIFIVSLGIPGQTHAASIEKGLKQTVDAGYNHTIVLKNDGTVWTWGENAYGQLGHDASSDPQPVKLADGNLLKNIKAISAGAYHNLAVTKDGLVYAWGRNSFGQLGQTAGSPVWNQDPTLVPGLTNIVAVAAGLSHSVAVDANGFVYVWGSNAFGQLGTGSTASYSETPVKINGLAKVATVASGDEHIVALTENGDVYGWGRNTFGQLGNGESKDKNSLPQRAYGLYNVVELAAGANHTLALSSNHATVWGFGLNKFGQLGDNDINDHYYPVQINGMTNVTQIACGDNHSVALKDDGSVWMWGRNTGGSLGSNAFTHRSIPIQVQGMNHAVTIGAGGDIDNNKNSTIAVNENGEVYMWTTMNSDPTSGVPTMLKVLGIKDVSHPEKWPFLQGSEVVFRYYGNGGTNQVKIKGSFNNWVELPLEKIDPVNDVWQLRVTLEPGEYTYGFYVDGKFTLDPNNSDIRFDNKMGDALNAFTVDPYVKVSPIVNNKNVTFTYSSVDDNGQLELDAKTESVSVVGDFSRYEEIPMVKGKNNIWSVTVPVQPGEKHYYSFIVKNAMTANPVKRNDPLNENLETNGITNNTRNTFFVSEQLPSTVPINKIVVKRDTINLISGEQEQIQYSIEPSNATNKTIVWTSSNPGIATVNSYGNITAISNGQATIFGTATDGSGKVAVIHVNVDKKSDSISYPKVGYRKLNDQFDVANDRVWKVKFTKELDESSIQNVNAYILNESEVKVPVVPVIGSNKKTIEFRPTDGFKYNAGESYYLFIEKNLRSADGKLLKEPIQMKFTIRMGN